MLTFVAISAAFLLAGCSDQMPPDDEVTHQWKIERNASKMDDTVRVTIQSPNLSHLDPMLYPTLSVQCLGKDAEVWFEAGWPAESEIAASGKASVRYRLDAAKSVSLLGATTKDRKSIRLGGAALVRDLSKAGSVTVEYTPYKFHAVTPSFDVTGLRAAVTDACPGVV